METCRIRASPAHFREMIHYNWIVSMLGDLGSGAGYGRSVSKHDNLRSGEHLSDDHPDRAWRRSASINSAFRKGLVRTVMEGSREDGARPVINMK